MTPASPMAEDENMSDELALLRPEVIRDQAAFLRNELPKKYHDFFDKLCRTALAARPGAGDEGVVCRRESPAPAWLVIQSDGSRSVHLSPLTDEVYIDEGGEAWALFREHEGEDDE